MSPTGPLPALCRALARPEPWQPRTLRIDPWTVLRLARYRHRESVPSAIWEAARAMAARAEALGAPRALLRAVAVEAAGAERVRLAGGSTFSGRAVAALLADCPVGVVFVLTLGADLERETVALAERRDLLEAFLLDLSGWAAIEALARSLRLDLAARVRSDGWRLTHRLGPGHLDWPLEEQRALVGLFAEAPGPVRLSEHGVLVPLKSISGVFGLKPG